MKRVFWLLLTILVICSILYWALSGQSIFKNLYGKNTNNNQVALAAKAFPSIEKIPEFVVVTFAGDVMFDRGVKASVNKNFNGDYHELLKNVKIFQDDDISFLNLEGPVSDVGRNVGSIYSFRMDPTIIDVLNYASVDIVNFANNHVGDYSAIAFKDTLKRLTDGNMLFTGAGDNYTSAITPTVIEKNNIKTCFLGFSDVGPNWMEAQADTAGILLASDPNFSKIISNAKTSCDVLIISFHWGDEYKPHNARQTKLAHLAIDSGADIIVGAHPHVAQDIEIYKDKPIMYSLGNFMFDQYFSPETMQGLVVQMKVYKDGRTSDIKEYTSQQNKMFQIESIIEKIQ